MSAKNNYSSLERFLHYFAFGIPHLQKALSELESDIYKNKLTAIESENEVFICGLARSGSTMLLNYLYNSNNFCSYSYSNMPFVLAPILWSKCCNKKKNEPAKVERFHKDQVLVSQESVEAFEEILWMNHYPEKYKGPSSIDRVLPEEITPAFKRAFNLYIKKILYLNRNSNRRFLSKNNSNLSRIPTLKTLLPNAIVIVPFRDPISQVSSLMQQHRLLASEQTKDSFVLDYMNWLGHFEFGLNFRPYHFSDSSLGSDYFNWTPNDWLQYWIDAYTFAEKNLKHINHLVPFEEVLKNPRSRLSRLNQVCLLDDNTLENSFVARAPTSKTAAKSEFSTGLLEEAQDLYNRLLKHSLNA